MGGGAWPFLVGGVICLVNSDNERDLNLLNSQLIASTWVKRGVWVGFDGSDSFVCGSLMTRDVLLRGTIRIQANGSLRQ